MIDVSVLENLKAFYECGTLSAAAEQLNMSQPTLSRSMQKLEDYLNIILFERKKNRISLNATGRLAAEYANELMKHAEELEERLRQFDRQLHVTAVAGGSPGTLSMLQSALVSTCPEKTITAELTSNAGILEGLLSSRFTLALLDRDISDEIFCSFPYLSERLSVAVPLSHPAAKHSSVSLKELNGETMLIYARTDSWEELLRLFLPETSLIRLDDLSSISALLASSLMPVICSDLSLEAVPLDIGDRRVVPFSEPEAFKQFYITCLRQNLSSTRPLIDAVLAGQRDTAL